MVLVFITCTVTSRNKVEYFVEGGGGHIERRISTFLVKMLEFCSVYLFKIFQGSLRSCFLLVLSLNTVALIKLAHLKYFVYLYHQFKRKEKY